MLQRYDFLYKEDSQYTKKVQNANKYSIFLYEYTEFILIFAQESICFIKHFFRMERWQNFYIQKSGQSETAKESVATWGIFCKSIPFVLFGEVKEPAKREYNDEHGDDEYIGSGGLYLKSYIIEVEFGCKKMANSTFGTVTDVQSKVATFLEYLRSAGLFKLYSSYTRIGRQNVRLDSISDNAKWVSNGEWKTVNNTRTFVVTEEYLVFKVKFKVNDPKTNIVYNNGSLVIAQ